VKKTVLGSLATTESRTTGLSNKAKT
jgi:hypothetical protein